MTQLPIVLTHSDTGDLLKPKAYVFDQKAGEKCLDKAPKVSVLTLSSFI